MKKTDSICSALLWSSVITSLKKIQKIKQENDYRKSPHELEKDNKSIHAYQLKAGKGVDPCVNVAETKGGLEEKGLKIKSVFNTENHERVPQPVDRVELETVNVI